MKIQTVAYNKYKLDWMLCRGLTLEDLTASILDYVNREQLITGKVNPIAPHETIWAWELNEGFKGELYACLNEFLENEFKNEGYMRQLLTTDEFIEWQKAWEN